MKVAVYQVTSSYAIGGCESYTWNLSRYLSARGHTCDLIAGLTEHPRCPYSDVTLHMARFIPRERVPDFGSRFRKLVERLSFGWHARNLLVSGRYDVLSIHKPYDIPAALWFRRKTGCRIVWRCHGTDFYPGLGRLINRVDAIYCVSHYARDALMAAYAVDPSVIHTGVDTRFFDPMLEARRVRATPSILYFGRFEGWKGVRYLVDALGQLRDLAWVARLVGEGPEQNALRQHVARLGLVDRVQVEPAVNGRNHVRRLLAENDIAVFPAVGVETFSNAVLEAMSMEMPVVATRVGGFGEAVEDGATGLLVEPRSAGALASAMRPLITDATLRRRLAEAARRQVVLRFDSDNSFAQVEDLFYTLSTK